MSVFRILALGDVVGSQAADRLSSSLSSVISSRGIDFTVVNGENACQGNGLDTENAKKLLAAGADVITSGNHVWKWREFRNFMDSSDRVVRPANYRSTSPGQGYTVLTVNGYRILVMNVMGTSFMEPLENPFVCIDRILDHMKGKYDFSILDIHAEATGEKYALGRYFDGRISVIFGTHTHVPTADDGVFPKGTGFVCDLGMCGPVDSVLGVKSEIIIEKLMTNIPLKYEVATGKIECRGVIFDIDADTGKTLKTERIVF